MAHPFLTVEITPNYALGFGFAWTLSHDFSDPTPTAWTFRVYTGPTETGPWTLISPVLGYALRYWAMSTNPAAPVPVVTGKDQVLFYKITLTTSAGTYSSEVRTPYGSLNRREWLIATEIMRREVLHMRTLAGQLCQFWSRATYGTKCTACLDVVTGEVTNANCDVCNGTRFIPGYYGPYDIWATFSNDIRDTVQSENGTVQPRTYRMRMIGFPYAKDGDVVVDVTTGRRFYVDLVEDLLELRSVSIVQQLTANMAPVTDAIYRLGTGVPGTVCTT